MGIDSISLHSIITASRDRDKQGGGNKENIEALGFHLQYSISYSIVLMFRVNKYDALSTSFEMIVMNRCGDFTCAKITFTICITLRFALDLTISTAYELGEPYFRSCDKRSISVPADGTGRNHNQILQPK